MNDQLKLLLVNPPLKNFEENPYPPLGLAYIAGAVEKEGFDVEIFDMPILKANLEDARMYLKKLKPDIVGISCIAANYQETMALARMAKELLDCRVAIGGPHVTFIPDQILMKNRYVNMVFRGEGELAMVELMRTIAKNDSLYTILGLSYKNDNGMILSNPERPLVEDIDALPFPARHLLPMKKYREKTRYTSLIGSRGCMYNCIYCSSSTFWCHKVRFRNTNKIMDEIKFIHERYGYDYFMFIDDIPIFYNRGHDFLMK